MSRGLESQLQKKEAALLVALNKTEQLTSDLQSKVSSCTVIYIYIHICSDMKELMFLVTHCNYYDSTLVTCFIGTMYIHIQN